ncbi:splicing factor U2AF 65 kDa subunit-like protein [Cladochytrium replicatum]|nr:splicing factor U2AF 65 kDa subunit-like protein [Cladochytrium replicatum]
MDLASSFLNSVINSAGAANQQGAPAAGFYGEGGYGSNAPRDPRRQKSRSRSPGRNDRKRMDRDRSPRDRDRDWDRERERDRDRDRGGRRDKRSRYDSRSPPRRRSRSPRDRRRRGSESPRGRVPPNAGGSGPPGGTRERSLTPIHLRKRKLTNWDVPPPGYETLTAQQAKATGLFPLPGQLTKPLGMEGLFAPFVAQAAAITDYSAVPPPMFGAKIPGKVTQGAAGPVALSASIARQARRLYVGNIPYGVQDTVLIDFFNEHMLARKLATSSQDPVISAQINHEKNYAFVEFRTPEEATSAMAFDGIKFQASLLKIRRPKDYQPPMGAVPEMPSIYVPGVVSTNVPDSPNKIYVGGLPPDLHEEQVMELLKAFGELRAFNLVKDSATGVSKGFAFCEYVDPNVTDIACQGLNNIELGDKKLVVQRASVGATRDRQLIGGMAPMTTMLLAPGAITQGSGEPSTVLLLLNMVTVEELANDDDYQDILEDVRDECSRYGTIRSVTIPRPNAGEQSSTGVGKIFVQYSTVDQCTAALNALAGRRFADRTVITAYYPESRYQTGEYV